VLPALAEHGQAVFAVDFPGFGSSSGRLTEKEATVPALAAWALRFLDAAKIDGPFRVAGHDIGGAVAQHLAVNDPRVEALVLMNSVLYDSWPVPAVERFRDPEVARSTTVAEPLEGRAESLRNAIARPLDEAERQQWLEPWHTEERVRSWIAMAAAADTRFTLELIPHLRERALPTLLIWGEDDEFQPLRFAERYVNEVPGTTLARIATSPLRTPLMLSPRLSRSSWTQPAPDAQLARPIAKAGRRPI
jgi:pimeloyl-ACP methyl ester carboxylesterase